MPGLLAVRLMAFEVVNCGRDGVTGFFAWANCVNLVTKHQQSLKWDHDFVVFHEVADDEQDFPDGHFGFQRS
jgi:hypothetical protein